MSLKEVGSRVANASKSALNKLGLGSTGGAVPNTNGAFPPTEVSKLVAKLENNPREAQVLRYPLDVATDGNGLYMLFNININEGSKFQETGSVNGKILKNPYSDIPTVQSSRKVEKDAKGKNVVKDHGSDSIRAVVGGTKRIQSSIAMYMPPTINVSYSADWQTTELGAVGNFAQRLQRIPNVSEIAGSDVKSVLQQSGTSLVSAAAGLSQFAGLNLKDANDLRRGFISNPHMEVLFKGTPNRPFEFTFEFAPKSEAEAREVDKIIKLFKFHQAPELFKNGGSANAYLKSPSEFEISFMDGESANPWLHRISTCALTGVGVDETPLGHYVDNVDGSPTKRILTLSFTELEIITKERVLDGF